MRQELPPGGLAWIGNPGEGGATPQGQWGAPDDLNLPLADRGLLLGDGLFETVLVAEGQPWLLAEHLDRWCQGASLLGLPKPPGEKALWLLIKEAIHRSGVGWGAVRLNWSRGSGGRGIDLPGEGEETLQPRFWLQFSPCRPTFSIVRVIVSAWERRDPNSLSSRCKTLAYGWAVQARREARAAGVDDALLLNTAGELCCGTTANLVLRLGDGGWHTPPEASGCLPGVMRRRALALGLIQETPLRPEALREASGAVLLNSLGCRALALPSVANLSVAEGDARRLWLTCLEWGSDAALG